MTTPDKATEIKAFFAAILAFFTALWGWLGWAVLILIVCMALDWITGSWAARRKNEWSSSVARDGLWHKLGEIVALLVAALCDIAIRVILESAAAPLLQGWDYGNYLTLLVAVWYIFTELGSIIENAGELGAPVPKWLRKGIAALQKKAEAAEPMSIQDEPGEKTNSETYPGEITRQAGTGGYQPTYGGNPGDPPISDTNATHS